MKLSEVAIQRPVLASMASAALVLFGVIGYTRLSVREFPDVDPPVISVTTTLPGAVGGELRPDAALRRRGPDSEDAAAEPARRGQRPDLRRATLRDAGVGEARPAVGARAHRAGRGERDPHEERGDSGRPDRVRAPRVFGPFARRAQDAAGVQ